MRRKTKKKKKKVQSKKVDTPLKNLKLTENKTNTELIVDLFNNSTIDEQWKFILEYKEYGVLILDNDNTVFRVKTDESFNNNEGCFEVTLKEYIGNNDGIHSLLKAVDIECQSC